ncbi:DNA primase [Cnuella takakiae]|uniref:DNA primase n=1 Tax=Cnuella takakiae TaxID=1302690 RepID=A0A1M4VM76_9BACT|nr:DNA primase [Cnuella takakiae]OLY92554.1 DNA primase [Cnuella takakiae]SHE70144.1 DNA primase [Cnuella takakiae]
MITQETIQQIQNRIDVLDIVGSFVKLKKRGANYLGLCPFHNEKSPSFTVSPSKEIFKCFGCGKSGNSISFVMEHEKLSYVEALRWLAARYNIEVQETETSPEKKQQYQTAESLHILNAFAQKFYARQLTETETGQAIGLSYLKERGFNDEIITKFGLGYAPESRDALTSEALANQYSAELLLKAGLSANRYEQLVDNYRDRIIFPIHNVSGKIIGFGARLIKKNDKAPKYINTPENELYIKSRILYGTYFARQAIDKADECLLVEGYTDVISLHQAGIENVVASGGTSLTVDQLRLIRKYTSNLTIIYDGDNAGIKAALRGLDMALEESLNVKLVLIPDGEDPDSYVRKVGAQEFRNFILRNKKDFIFFQLEVLLKEAGGDAQKKSEVVNGIAETISKIDKAEDFTRQQDYIRKCAELLQIDESGFTNLVNKNIRNRISAQEGKIPFEEAQVHAENARKAEETNFTDETFNLIFKDEIYERDLARVLLEFGDRQYDDTRNVVEYVLSELPDESLFENKQVKRLIDEYRIAWEGTGSLLERNFFIYNEDHSLSTLAVSVLQKKDDESPKWKSEMSQSSGYQKNFFNTPYEEFMATIHNRGKKTINDYLKIAEDKYQYDVDKVVTYINLKKVKRLLLENQHDLQNLPYSDKMKELIQTHNYLKNLEMELSKKLGSVIFK